MKLVSTVCENCGDKVLEDAPKGLCPACVLETGLGPLAGEPVAGGVDSGHPAEVLKDFGDYELLEEIGRGGQGVVYRARQKSLNRTVALKVIGLGQWATPAHLKRFRREAESAANLDHPCIVPIYDVGEREGSCYFSMKFVDGGQLDEVARRTPISIRDAAELIAKLARTVYYAHEHGILHRDIKPGNILVDAKGEPHLTDFGLARLLETKSTVTHTMDVLGTPSYMAPEQASGHNEQLTSATDVYGLGAVLYQLLTGRPPFAGGTTYETVRLVLETEPRPPRLWNPKIDRELSTICLKCLEKDPKRRYPSALALAEDLEHWLKHEPIRAKRSGFFTHARKWVRRNPSIAALVTLSVALAAGLGVMTWNRGRESASPIAKSVAVLPFENLSREPDSAYFADGIQQEILTRLASIADLKVISCTSTQRYQSKPRNLGEIAKQLGVANILEGSVQKAADQVRVNVQLINAQTDSHLWADTYDRKLTDIFGVESEIAKRIAESLQAKLSGREEQALAVKPTNNPEAYDAYLRGSVFQTRISYSSTDPLRTAIGFFERAVQLDPNFALAWARLSREDARLYFYHADYTATRRDAARRALENAQKIQPNSPETLLALGYYQYWVLRDYGLAKTTFGLVSKMLPGSSEVPYALGSVNRREGNWDESVANFEQGLALDPRNADLLNNTAVTYAMLRQFPAALKLYDRVLDILPNDPDVMAIKAGIYQAQGNLQEAAKLLVEVNAQTPSGAAFATKVTQLRLERNLGEAIRLLRARQPQFHFASDIDKGGDSQAALVLVQRVAGDTAGAEAAAEQARSTFEPLRQDQRDNVRFAEWLSFSYAALGNKDSALKEAERAIVLSPSAKDQMDGPGYEETLALIRMIFGDNSRAISTLTRLLQTPYNSWLYWTPVTPALLRLDPIWDPLRADPAFQKLCEEKIDKSIAVLPFENLSRDPDNAYLADGIQEEILTRLVSIADLKVISRSSTQQYQNKPRNLAEIAKQLGVANVLEGSVQKASDHVRVNVQLVNAQTDSHLWAETYDRKLTDIFSVESEIAKGVAESLQAKLSGREERAFAVKPTNNPAAYDAYLRGRAFADASSWIASNVESSIQSYQHAVALDPGFALAWARLSYEQMWSYWQGFDASPARLAAAKEATDRAVALDPDLPEVHRALAYYRYYAERDFSRALTEFRAARQGAPNDADTIVAIACVQSRLGHFDEAIVEMRRAMEFYPRDVLAYQALAEALGHLRRFPEALAAADSASILQPADSASLRLKANLLWRSTGDVEAVEPLLKNSAAIPEIRARQFLFRRDYAAAIGVLSDSLPTTTTDQRMGGYLPERQELQLLLGLSQQRASDGSAARATYQQAVRDIRRALAGVASGSNMEATLHSALGEAYAGLGDADAAIKEGRKAMAIIPASKDAADGPVYEEKMARIFAQLGDADGAIDLLKRLLQTPYDFAITPALLRLDPMFDPLRNDPRFQELCKDKQL